MKRPTGKLAIRRETIINLANLTAVASDTSYRSCWTICITRMPGQCTVSGDCQQP